MIILSYYEKYVYDRNIKIDNFDFNISKHILEKNNIKVDIYGYLFSNVDFTLLIFNFAGTRKICSCKNNTDIYNHMSIMYNFFINKRDDEIKKILNKKEDEFSIYSDLDGMAKVYSLDDQKYDVDLFLKNINNIFNNSKVLLHKKISLYLSLKKLLEEEQKIKIISDDV